jgi:hypothetical protein
VGSNPTRSIFIILGNYGTILSFFLASPNRLITGVLLPHSIERNSGYRNHNERERRTDNDDS